MLSSLVSRSTPFSVRHWFTQLLERTAAKFSVRVALTITLTLTYGGGLWLHLFHQAGGATELNEPPAIIHWLRDSTLMLPLVLVSVFAALFFARWLLQRFGGNAPRLIESVVVVGSIALITSVALALASPIHNSFFQAHHPANHLQNDAEALRALLQSDVQAPLALEQGEAELPIALEPSDDLEASLAFEQSQAETSLGIQPASVDMPLVRHMLYDGTLALIGNLMLSSILFALFRERLWGMRATRRIWVNELVLSAQPTRR